MNKNLLKCMDAIHIFITFELGGTNIKKKKSSKPYLVSENKRINEGKFKQIHQADERALWSFYNSLASCISCCFYPYECPMFPQVNPSNKLENNKTNKQLYPRV